MSKGIFRRWFFSAPFRATGRAVARVRHHLRPALPVETSSVVYSISRRILKHEHAQKHPSHPAPPPSHLTGLHAGEGKRHLPGTPLPSQPRHHLPRT